MALSGLALYRSSTTGAESVRYFIDTTQLGVISGASGSATCTGGTFYSALLMQGSNTQENGGSMQVVADVTQKTQPSAPSFESTTVSFSGVFLTQDPVALKFHDLFITKPVDSGASFPVAMVDVWDSNKLYYAMATVVVTSYGGDSGDKLNISGEISLSEDWRLATKAASIDPDTGIMTEAA